MESWCERQVCWLGTQRAIDRLTGVKTFVPSCWLYSLINTRWYVKPVHRIPVNALVNAAARGDIMVTFVAFARQPSPFSTRPGLLPHHTTAPGGILSRDSYTKY